MRRFVFLGAVFLAALFSGGCARNPATNPKVDTALATLVPADTVLMAGVRMEPLEKTPLYRKYLADLRFPPVDDFAKRTGVDPRKDLSELLFVSNGKQGVVLGRGNFAGEEPRLEHSGAKRFGYKGFNLIGDEQTAVVFINSGTAAAGEISALKSLIDQRPGSRGPPPALAALTKEIPPESQIWAAYLGSPATLDFGGNVDKLLGSLESGSLYFDLGAGLNGVASGLCSNERGAQDVEGALKVMVALARLERGIRITQAERRVNVYIGLPPELVEKFLNSWVRR